MTKNRRSEGKDKLWCPYCDEGIMTSQLPYCQPCKVVEFYCPECKKPVSRDNKVCPNCGAKIQGEKT